MVQKVLFSKNGRSPNTDIMSTTMMQWPFVMHLLQHALLFLLQLIPFCYSSHFIQNNFIPAPYTVYEFKVQAATSAGLGNFSPPREFRTREGGTRTISDFFLYLTAFLSPSSKNHQVSETFVLVLWIPPLSESPGRPLSVPMESSLDTLCTTDQGT